jgi:hypothetical protein
MKNLLSLTILSKLVTRRIKVVHYDSVWKSDNFNYIFNNIIYTLYRFMHL